MRIIEDVKYPIRILVEVESPEDHAALRDFASGMYVYESKDKPIVRVAQQPDPAPQPTLTAPEKQRQYGCKSCGKEREDLEEVLCESCQNAADAVEAIIKKVPGKHEDPPEPSPTLTDDASSVAGQETSGSEGETAELPPKTGGFRIHAEDRAEIPSVIAMKHVLGTAKKHGAINFISAMRIVYGDELPVPHGKLDMAYREVWKEMKDGV